MSITEEKVINAVSIELQRMSYQIIEMKAKGEKGIDIKARHQRYNRYFYIEAKGDPSKNVKYPSSGREVRFLSALGQILTHIDHRQHIRYGIAFPNTYRKLVFRRLNYTLIKKLKLEFFFVSGKGKVLHITWKDMKEAQE